MSLDTTLNGQVFDQFPVLETERFVLNAFDSDTETDMYALFRLRSEPSIMTYMDRNPLLDVNEARAFNLKVSQKFEDKKSIQWAIRSKKNHEIVGYFCAICLRYEHRRAEIGYILLPEHHKNGIIHEVGTRVITFLHKEMRCYSLDAIINPGNHASRRVLLKLGFMNEGYQRSDYQFNGNFLDSEKYGIVMGN
jgi:[ribosomal protein S5]-alanine N-acetyltransferase